MRNATVPEYRALLKNLVTGLQPQAKTTFCNYFCHAIACAFGFRGFFDVEKGRVKMANEIDEYLDSESTVDGGKFSLYYGSYITLVDDVCRFPLFVIASQRAAVGSGHCCVLAPELGLVASAKWPGTVVPKVANVGKTNFYGKGLNHAFGKTMPKIYVWNGIY